MDCSIPWKGCCGGWMYAALEFVQCKGGLATEESYQYMNGTDNHQCRLETIPLEHISISQVHKIEKNENELMSAVASIGPIAVGFYVSNDFMAYKEGKIFISVVYYMP
jgi:hypothetical protein